MLIYCDSKLKGKYFNIHFQSALKNHILYSTSHQIGAWSYWDLRHMNICLKLLINMVFNKVNMRMHFLTSLSIHVYYFLCVENDSIYDGEWLWIAKHFIPVTHIFLPGIVPQTACSRVSPRLEYQRTTAF